MNELLFDSWTHDDRVYEHCSTLHVKTCDFCRPSALKLHRSAIVGKLMWSSKYEGVIESLNE